MSQRKHRVVIVGGGFAGLQAARALGRADVELTLIDRRNFHLFQPLLYQVATGGLSPADIASPIRSVLSRNRNTRVIQGEVVGFDVSQRLVRLESGDDLPYDTLILAAGNRNDYFGQTDWEQIAPGLKSIEDALEIRRKVFSAFETAERETDAQLRERLMSFVIVGGRATGVELAGAVAELARHTLRKDFRRIDTSTANIYLLEYADRLLAAFSHKSSANARSHLESLGVRVVTGAKVSSIEQDYVEATIDGATERFAASTILWAAGVKGSSLGKKLAEQVGLECDRQGRVPVKKDLTISGYPEIFVAGDLARVPDDQGNPLPGVAPVAMQQGAFIAQAIVKRINGQSPETFKYRDYGRMAVIGRSAAVAEVGRWKIRGFPAWLAWLWIHLINLVEFQNRLLVAVQWGWNYLTRNRSARLITYDRELRSTPVLDEPTYDER